MYCVQMCVCCPIFASVLALHNSVHVVSATVLLCTVGPPIAGGWRYLLGVMTHPSSHSPEWSKQKVIGRWREKWCSGGTPNPTCWRQSVAQNGCTEEGTWRKADRWVWACDIANLAARSDQHGIEPKSSRANTKFAQGPVFYLRKLTVTFNVTITLVFKVVSYNVLITLTPAASIWFAHLHWAWLFLQAFVFDKFDVRWCRLCSNDKEGHQVSSEWPASFAVQEEGWWQ